MIVQVKWKGGGVEKIAFIDQYLSLLRKRSTAIVTVRKTNRNLLTGTTTAIVTVRKTNRNLQRSTAIVTVRKTNRNLLTGTTTAIVTVRKTNRNLLTGTTTAIVTVPKTNRNLLTGTIFMRDSPMKLDECYGKLITRQRWRGMAQAATFAYLVYW